MINPPEPLLPPHLDPDAINELINSEICYMTIDKLTDASLLDTYKKSESVIRMLNMFRDTLDKYVEDENTKLNIINDWLPNLVPAGTKGVIRGNQFNQIIKNHILSFKLDSEIYDIQFETQHPDHMMPEKPDWYIYNKTNKKIVVGMNQVALWGGGQQENRGSKYISVNNQYNNEHCKLLCVVCDHVQFKSNNKTCKMFKIGFENNTICYLNGMYKKIMAFLQ
jgi:hypothetical protein